MSDTVTSSAIAAGDIDQMRRDENQVKALFGGTPQRGAPFDDDLEQALKEVADYPSVGAVAVIEMARADAGWTALQGAKNGLKVYRKFAGNLQSSGWFTKAAKGTTQLPDFTLDDPLASVKAIAQAAYPELDGADQVRAAAAMIRSLSVALGPDGVAVEEVEEPALKGKKPEVLEKRVTTIASHVATMGDTPRFAMNWSTETFTRTKKGKDKPKSKTTETHENHKFVFNTERWKSGDRSAFIEYYRRVEKWLDDMNTSGGRTRSMACFTPIL